MAEITITHDNFKTEVIEAEKTVILDFWADWCGPCTMIAPLLHEIAAQRSDIKVGKVNVDEEPALAAAYGIVSIPTLIKIKDGKEVAQSVGYVTKEQLEKWIGE